MQHIQILTITPQGKFRSGSQHNTPKLIRTYTLQLRAFPPDKINQSLAKKIVKPAQLCYASTSSNQNKKVANEEYLVTIDEGTILFIAIKKINFYSIHSLSVSLSLSLSQTNPHRLICSGVLVIWCKVVELFSWSDSVFLLPQESSNPDRHASQVGGGVG